VARVEIVDRGKEDRPVAAALVSMSFLAGDDFVPTTT
jgi:hypothetical protein